MSRNVVVVTGLSRHSLGEAFVRHLLTSTPAYIIGIGRSINQDLPALPDLHQIPFDLNPFNFDSSLDGFSSQLQQRIIGVLRSWRAEQVDSLVQCAGVYEFGRLLDHRSEVRSEILGVNVVGVTEVLYAIMKLNRTIAPQATAGLSHLLVGSYQGLYARDHRPIYPPSKAHGIDFCTSLAEGQELSRCVYVAPGPIDTPMLHRNHWLTRASGNRRFFDTVVGADRSTYRSVFVDCDQATVAQIAREKFAAESDGILSAMREYAAIRRESMSDHLGLLTPQACAEAMAYIFSHTRLPSGVCSITAKQGEQQPHVRMAQFSALDRRATFESVATRVMLF